MKIRMNENANKLIERIQTRTAAQVVEYTRNVYTHKILRGN